MQKQGRQVTIDEINALIEENSKLDPKEILVISSISRLQYVQKKQNGEWLCLISGQVCELIEITAEDYLKELNDTKTQFDKVYLAKKKDDDLAVVSVVKQLRRTADGYSDIMKDMYIQMDTAENMEWAIKSMNDGRRWLGVLLGFIDASPYAEFPDYIEAVERTDKYEGDIQDFYGGVEVGPNLVQILGRLRAEIKEHLITFVKLENDVDIWNTLSGHNPFVSQYVFKIFTCFQDSRMYLGELIGEQKK